MTTTGLPTSASPSTHGLEFAPAQGLDLRSQQRVRGESQRRRDDQQQHPEPHDLQDGQEADHVEPDGGDEQHRAQYQHAAAGPGQHQLSSANPLQLHERSMTGTHAIGSVRVSTEEQAASGLGPVAQEAALRAECERCRRSVEVVADRGASGKQVNPDLRRALDLRRRITAAGPRQPVAPVALRGIGWARMTPWSRQRRRRSAF